MVRKKLVLIQFSRALVPILVMLFHLSGSMMDYFEFNLFGFSYLPISGGVDYFFALSGFIMYYIYRDSLGQSNQLKNYLLNRFIRVYPLYWFLTFGFLAVLFLYPNYGVGHETDTDTDTIITSFLLLQSPRELEPILNVAWSLVHTVFFYLVFSLLFFSRIHISKALIAIWAVLTVCFSMEYIYIDNYLIRFFFNQYNLIFLAGIFCAYLVTHYKFNFKMSVLFSIIGVLGFPIIWLNSIDEYINISFDMGIGLASVFIIFGLASIDLQRNIHIAKSLNYLGNAAFSIYLSHNLVLDFLSELVSEFSIYEILGGWMTSIILLVFMLGVGCLVHSFIEKPLILKMKKLLLIKNVEMKNVSRTV